MDLLSLLKREHRHANSLLEKLANTSDGARKTRENLFGEIKMALEVHTRIEETHLYPVIRQNEELRDLERHAEEEHRKVKQMLGEMAKLAVDDEEFMSKVEALTSAIKEHVEEEERDMLPKAEAELGNEQCERIARLLQAEKQKLMQSAR
jgi:hemerythrin-like domain-containing protein